MPNDLPTLRTQLGEQLRDSTHAIWLTGEKDNLLNQSASRLWPKVMKPTRIVQALSLDAEQYVLNIALIDRVDILDDTGKYAMPFPGRAWETWEGDDPSASVTLFVNRAYSLQGRSIRVHGYVPYNLTTSLPTDKVAALILARARAEAYRRMGADRAKFRQWATTNQQQNVTMNELIQLINEADGEARMLEEQSVTWRRPVQGIQG